MLAKVIKSNEKLNSITRLDWLLACLLLKSAKLNVITTPLIDIYCSDHSIKHGELRLKFDGSKAGVAALLMICVYHALDTSVMSIRQSRAVLVRKWL